MAEEEGTEWLFELLKEVQLEQFFTRIKDELQVCMHIQYAHNDNLHDFFDWYKLNSF